LFLNFFLLKIMMLLISKGLKELSIYLITWNNIIVVIWLRFLQQIQYLLATLSLVSPILYSPSCLILDCLLNIKLSLLLFRLFLNQSLTNKPTLIPWKTVQKQSVQKRNVNPRKEICVLFEKEISFLLIYFTLLFTRWCFIYIYIYIYICRLAGIQLTSICYN